MSACVCSSLYSVSALTVLTAGALSSSAKVGYVIVFGAPSTRLQLLTGSGAGRPQHLFHPCVTVVFVG